MQTATASAIPIDQSELPSMIATLCFYESWFGPYHPQTLSLTTQVAIAYWQAVEFDCARRLLERVVSDVGRHLGGVDHPETLATRANLVMMLLENMNFDTREV